MAGLVDNLASGSFAAAAGSVSLEEGDLLPLAYLIWSVEDIQSLYSRSPKAQHSSLRTFWCSPGDGKAERLQCVSDWMWCVVISINYLYTAQGKEACSQFATSVSPTMAQLESLSQSWLAVDEFIGSQDIPFSCKDWPTVLLGSRLSYDGEVVAKAVDITVEQVLPGLPPIGVAGSIQCIDLLPHRLQPLLADPSLSTLPREEWPDRFVRPRMRIAKEEWKKLGPELVRRNICKPISASSLIVHDGAPLLNSIFGVGKNKFITGSDGQSLEVLRLIINLVPSNSIQCSIPGDIDTLLHFRNGVALNCWMRKS